jgi:hypothetical protein
MLIGTNARTMQDALMHRQIKGHGDRATRAPKPGGLHRGRGETKMRRALRNFLAVSRAYLRRHPLDAADVRA